LQQDLFSSSFYITHVYSIIFFSLYLSYRYMSPDSLPPSPD
jgi:hypothetical protein